jgi:cell cycle arrest protein BUB3
MIDPSPITRVVFLNLLPGVLPPPSNTLTSHPTPSAILCAQFSLTHPNIAYSSGLDKRLRQWDFDRGQERVIGKSEGEGAGVMACLTVLRDGRVITGGWDGCLRVWDP